MESSQFTQRLRALLAEYKSGCDGYFLVASWEDGDFIAVGHGKDETPGKRILLSLKEKARELEHYAQYGNGKRK